MALTSIICKVPITWVAAGENVFIAPDLSLIPNARRAGFIAKNDTHIVALVSGDNLDTSNVETFQTREAAIAALQ